ncbi:LptF/LptG family permease [Algihabitans albus]|uniref:LptF/LptG family permease n=1 Tax=Algihabitans albus TaxID=2164067 RepID=UPI000E5D2DB7|nr:LptF/LptG family permease [Algihabitans albus]
MKTLDRYLLSETLCPFAVTLLLALLVLLVERLLRLLDLALGTEGPLRVLVQMLTYLVPHYIGLALPFGFFLGVLIGFRRLHRDSELDALLGSGISLFRLLWPSLGVALVVAAISLATLGYLQPHSRYAYKSMVHSATSTVIQAILEPGTFTSIEGTTLFVEEISTDRRQFRQVFLYTQNDNGAWTAVTAEEGLLVLGESGQAPTVVLQNGVLLHGPGAGPGSRGPTEDGADRGAETDESESEAGAAEKGTLRFESRTAGLAGGSSGAFPPRGSHEREMTLSELWQQRHRLGLEVDPADMVAEFHGRIVRILSVLVLPFLAVPLALGTRNRGRGRLIGIAIGIVVLIGYHETLSFGENLVESEKTSPLLGLWLPFLVFLAASLAAFLRVAQRLSLGTILAWSGARQAVSRGPDPTRSPVEAEARRCAS